MSLAQASQSSDRFIQHLLLLAKSPPHVRLARLGAVIEHLMRNRYDTAAAWQFSAELHTIAITQRLHIGTHEIRAPRYERIQPNRPQTGGELVAPVL